MHKMAFAHVFSPEKKNGFGPFSYKFFVCIRVGLSHWDMDTVVMKNNFRDDMRYIIDCWNLDDSSRREKRRWSETCMSDVVRISLI